VIDFDELFLVRQPVFKFDENRLRKLVAGARFISRILRSTASRLACAWPSWPREELPTCGRQLKQPRNGSNKKSPSLVTEAFLFELVASY
jgi:hypothetical protein